MKEVSAGAIIFRKEGKNTLYLILHYESGHWDFVKGKIEEKENEKETVIREAEEEAGLKDLSLIETFREKLSYFYKKEGETVYKEVIFLLAETRTKEIKLSYEHKGFKWLSYEEALKQLTYDNAKNVLRKASEFLKDVISQKHLNEFG